MDASPNVEQMMTQDTKFLEQFGKDLVESFYLSENTRRSEFFVQMLKNCSKEELASNFGISETRVGHLSAEVRAAIRASERIVNGAKSVAKLLEQEPWSTESEIRKDLGMEAKEVKMALKFMLKRGIVKPSSDMKSYALTNLDYEEDLSV
jgi:transcription initiation factor IIE alpha subunit